MILKQKIKQERDFYKMLYERERRNNKILNTLPSPEYIHGQGIEKILDYWDKKVLSQFI